MQKFTVHQGLVAPMDRENVDTDAIIPKQFLKSIRKTGFGQNLFDEWRYLDAGFPGQDATSRKPKPDFVLNQPRYQGASVLLARRNFGCGSSREHAPQSLRKYGFNGVIAESFAEIFYGNSTTLAMPCVMASAADIVAIRDAVEADPSVEIIIDVAALKVRTSSGLDIPVTMPDSAREALLSGRWDPIQELLDNLPAIDAKAVELHYV